MGFDIAAFLAEPLRPAAVATVSAMGRPALATMWFLFEGDMFWLHSPRSNNVFVGATENRELVSIMVETFDPAGRVIQVRATGPASIGPSDDARVHRIYDRYLGPNDLWTPEWQDQRRSEAFALWSIEPASGKAVQYPELREDDTAFRWNDTATFLARLASRGT